MSTAEMTTELRALLERATPRAPDYAHPESESAKATRALDLAMRSGAADLLAALDAARAEVATYRENARLAEAERNDALANIADAEERAGSASAHARDAEAMADAAVARAERAEAMLEAVEAPPGTPAAMRPVWQLVRHVEKLCGNENGRHLSSIDAAIEAIITPVVQRAERAEAALVVLREAAQGVMNSSGATTALLHRLNGLAAWEAVRDALAATPEALAEKYDESRLLSFGDHVRLACINQLATHRYRPATKREIAYLDMKDLLKEWQEPRL